MVNDTHTYTHTCTHRNKQAAVQDNGDIRPESPWSDMLRHDYWGAPITDPRSHKYGDPLILPLEANPRHQSPACPSPRHLIQYTHLTPEP